MAEKNFAVLLMDKLNKNNLQEMKKRFEHVNRVNFAENVNKELSHLNRCVMGEEGSDWCQLFKTRYKELEHYKDPNSRKLYHNAVIGIEAVATISHDMVGKIDIDAWVDATNKWMQEYFGKENVVHGVLHMDEVSPHIHYYVTPVKDGKFMAYEILGNKQKFRDRQTEYATAMEPLGLKRGLGKSERMHYTSINKLYSRTQDVAGIPEFVEGETIEEYRKRVGEEYKALQMKVNSLELINERLEITREYATDLEKETHKLQDDYSNLMDKNKRLEHNFKYRRLVKLP